MNRVREAARHSRAVGAGRKLWAAWVESNLSVYMAVFLFGFWLGQASAGEPLSVAAAVQQFAMTVGGAIVALIAVFAIAIAVAYLRDEVAGQ